MTTTHPSVRRPALALLLWAWYTLLALVVAFPFFGWLTLATAGAPETDPLLDGLHFGTLVEILQASAGRAGGVSSALTAALGLALLSNAFLGGGLFALLAGPAREGRLLARFFEAAGRFFLRSLGLVVVSGVGLVLVGGAAAALAGAALEPFLSGADGRGPVAQSAIVLLLVAGVAAYFLLVLDYARVWMVRHDASGVVRTWLRGAWFVLRHPVAAATPGVVFGLGILATVGMGAWVAGAVGGRTWGTILGVLLAQQALVYGRALLRVHMVGAEGRAARAWGPPVAASSLPVTGASLPEAAASLPEPPPEGRPAEAQPAGEPAEPPAPAATA